MFTFTKLMLRAAAVIAVVSAPSAAYARLNLDPISTGVAIGQTQTQTQSASPVVSPNPDQQNPQTSNPGVAGRAGVSEFARCPVRGPCFSPESVLTRGSKVNSVRPTSTASSEGFQWDDAGIGAAGMLLLVSAGVAVAAPSRRQRHRFSAS